MTIHVEAQNVSVAFKVPTTPVKNNGPYLIAAKGGGPDVKVTMSDPGIAVGQTVNVPFDGYVAIMTLAPGFDSQVDIG